MSHAFTHKFTEFDYTGYWIGTFAHMVRPPPSCFIPKQHGRRYYCFGTSMLRAVMRFGGSMVVDDRARGARNIHSSIVAKTSVIQRAHCKCSIRCVVVHETPGLAAWAGVSVVLVSVHVRV